jgi:hypothetical protein
MPHVFCLLRITTHLNLTVIKSWMLLDCSCRFGIHPWSHGSQILHIKRYSGRSGTFKASDVLLKRAIRHGPWSNSNSKRCRPAVFHEGVLLNRAIRHGPWSHSNSKRCRPAVFHEGRCESESNHQKNLYPIVGMIRLVSGCLMTQAVN